MQAMAVVATLAWVALSGVARPAAAPQTPQRQPTPQRNIDDVDVQVLPVRGNIYMLVGAGGNVTLQIGRDGVLVVDSGSGPKSDAIVAAIRRLTDRPIRWIVNTHYHSDHTGGNRTVSKAGRSIPQVAIGAGRLFTDADDVANIVAHENVLKRMTTQTGEGASAANENRPVATFFGDEEELFFNGEPILLIHQPSAHTDGDVLVFFRRSDIVAAGDIFVTHSYPVIDIAAGGTFGGYLDALNNVIHITIPEEKQEGGTYVIPGHGRLSDEADVVDVRDMVTIVRDRIQSMIARGMTLDQVKAARPTLDYDDRYRASGGTWTPDMFVEAAYRTLSPTAVKAGS